MEANLIERCARGDHKAFTELVERMERPLINFIYQYVGSRDIAEDIFQETFIRVMKSIRRYKPTASLTTWIFTIARNLCLDHAKYQKRHKTISIDRNDEEDGIADQPRVIYLREALASAVESPHDRCEKSEESEALTNALKELSPVKRESLILRIFHGIPYQDIAKITDAPVGTAKYRVHEAIEDLQAILAKGKTNEGGLANEM